MQKKHIDFGNNFFCFSKTSDGCKNALEAIFSESFADEKYENNSLETMEN